MSQDCECKIVYGVADQTTAVGYSNKISFCSLHAAAPVLVETLQAALDANISGNDWEKQARKALALANGKRIYRKETS